MPFDKRTQGKPGEHLKQLTQMLSGHPLALWTTDRQMVVQSAFWSPVATNEIRVYSSFIGKHIRDVLASDAVEGDLAILEAAHERGVAGGHDFYTMKIQNREAQCFVSPLHDEAGGIGGAVGLAIDVTDFMSRYEGHLGWLKGADRTHDQMEIVCYMAVSLPDTTYIWLNDYCAQQFGHEPSFFVGKRWIEHLPPKEQKYMRRKIAELTPDKPVMYVENSVTRAEGKAWVHWINRGIFEGDKLVRIEAIGVEVPE